MQMKAIPYTAAAFGVPINKNVTLVPVIVKICHVAAGGAPSVRDKTTTGDVSAPHDPSANVYFTVGLAEGDVPQVMEICAAKSVP